MEWIEEIEGWRFEPLEEYEKAAKLSDKELKETEQLYEKLVRAGVIRDND